MKKRRYKEIEKSLPQKHGEIVFSVVGGVRKQGFNKYEFKRIRERIYLEAEKLVKDHIPAEDGFRIKLEQEATRLSAKAIKRKPAEVVGNMLFIVFTICAVSFPVIYGLNFLNSSDQGMYSRGIYLFLSTYHLFLTYVYCAFGIVVATFLQRIEKEKKKRFVAIACTACLIVGLALYILYIRLPDTTFKINFVVGELLCCAIAVGGYFLEEIPSARAFKKKYGETIRKEKEENGKENASR